MPVIMHLSAGVMFANELEDRHVEGFRAAVDVWS